MKSLFSKMFSISRLASRSLMFCVIPVGMPPHFRKRFQISTPVSYTHLQQGGIVRGAGLGIKKVAKKGVGTATGFAHNKVHQVEKENSGVESAHKSEETLEGLYRFSKGRKKTREKSARRCV